MVFKDYVLWLDHSSGNLMFICLILKIVKYKIDLPFQQSWWLVDFFSLVCPLKRMQQQSLHDWKWAIPDIWCKIWKQNFLNIKKKSNKPLTKDVCCPNKSTCCNIRCNPSTTKHRSRIIYHSIYSSQLLEQEKCCTNTHDYNKTCMLGRAQIITMLQSESLSKHKHNVIALLIRTTTI